MQAKFHCIPIQTDSPSDNIFLAKDQWSNCSGPFRPQQNVSVQTCGFDSFYYGSGKCSNLKLENIDKNVLEKCSIFGSSSSSSFDDACGKCTNAISKEVDNLVADLGVRGNISDEKGVCLVAVVVSVLAGKMNLSTSADDFDRCLPALANPVKYSYKEKHVINSSGDLSEALLAVTLVMIGLAMIIMLIKHVTKTEKQIKKEKTETLNKELAARCSGLYRFSKTEIENAINYTAVADGKQLLGRGSAGQVYKGMLPSGQLIAIKQLFRTNTSDSFAREIDGLSRVRHANLVCLFGCGIASGVQYLVYEYCSNGNLAQHLLRKDCVLTWDLRVKILRGCACALRYLHYHADGCIVHRDIKVIFLIFFFNSGEIYRAKDVSIGKRPLTDFVDPRMKGNVNYVDFESILQIAVLCAANSSKGRPTIDLVFDELERAWNNTSMAADQMIARKGDEVVSSTPSGSLELMQPKEMSCFPCFQKKEEESSNENNNDLPIAQPKDFTPPSPSPPPPVNNSNTQDPLDDNDDHIEETEHSAVKSFTFRELATATKNFRQECLLGEGGFGKVFKGTLVPSGQVVAVRQLDRNGVQGGKDFVLEVSTLSFLHHQNLVKIIGYCADGDQRLLVYEYLSSGSLKNHLFDLPAGKKPIDWSTRMKVALGIAEGLEYLHEKADPPIIYRDLKSSNILLDDANNPRLSEYGLAKLVQSGNKMQPRVMAGYGYCAPEYERQGELTLKSDVYSFGVVLLELITGRPAMDTARPTEEQNLVSWKMLILIRSIRSSSLS
ncbi:PREDICTED: uncharacterized protein LOC105955356 [Erythranthe guttata]|uniref:uncharacterized protein LOC105955356 n=1 Tax=Erythranthe guttata TaxID=4155 RepID=UPI00064DD9AD|nr:PREDICTED: uncharacterized protein LOC105955356 [Erythranthe guttata]|eukprot:XP_012834525.1 PREDICTED: uncharacterized protein LOC105955356 [Erythranthe guttata]